MTSGSCLCGVIEYRCSGPITDCSYCHCSICRKLSGSAFAAYGTVAKECFAWLKGKPDLAVFHPGPATTRYFCRHCGSFLLTEHIRYPQNVFVTLGTLDDAKDLHIEYHQFTATKAPWFNIDDGLPEYPAWSEDD